MKFKAAILLSMVVLSVPRLGLAGEDSSRHSNAQVRHSLLTCSRMVLNSNVAVSARSLFNTAADGRNLASAIGNLESPFEISKSVVPNPMNEIGQEKKSAFLAVVYSLVLPGMGELYSERFDLGRYSLIAEAALWLAYAGFQFYGTWLQDDARSFAVMHAGINPAGKDDQFYVNVGNFLNAYDYNNKKLRDRDLDKVYDDPSYSWQWDNDADRARFRDLRVSADNAFNNSRFVIAAVIVNHIISAINAARLTSKYNSALETRTSSFEIRASVLGSLTCPDGIAITLQRSF